MAVRRSSGRVTWSINPGEEIHRVAGALRQIDRSMPAKLRKDLRKAAAKGVADAKTSVRNIPRAKSKRKTRREIARGVRTQVSTGSARYPARMRIVTVMQPGKEMLPRGFQDEFTHPVFGSPQQVSQQMHHDWFIGPIGDQYPFIARDVQDILEDAAEYVARHGERGGL